MKATPYLLAGAVVVALIAAGAILWRNQQSPVAKPDAPPQVAVAAPTAVEVPASSASEPGIRHPIEVPVDVQHAVTPQDLETALVDLFGRKTVLSMFQTQDFARRFVATVDNLGRSHAPVASWPVNPTAGRLVVEKKDGGDVIGADNGLRYTPFVLLVDGGSAQGGRGLRAPVPAVAAGL